MPPRCAGKYPVEWVYPTDEPASSGIPPISSRVAVDTEKIPGDNPRPYLAHLTVRDLQFTDTDNYFCRYIGTEGLDHPTNVTSTYLFASDEDNLLDVYIPFEWFNVMQGPNSVDEVLLKVYL